jgi:hypothetical protein
VATEAGCAVAGPPGRPPGGELVAVARPGLLPALTAALAEVGVTPSPGG